MNTTSSLHSVSRKVSVLFGLGLFSTSLLAVVSPANAQYGIEPGFGVDDGSFRRCTEQLLSAKIDQETALNACARAFKPEETSNCVTRIARNTALAPADVLTACRQVRRPLELGNCVVDIRKELESAEEASVLNSCRRSLLPERYASCVVGISEETAIEPNPAMQKCLAAGDFYPAELDPTFLPEESTSLQNQ